jgi:hypothetical protein
MASKFCSILKVKGHGFYIETLAETINDQCCFTSGQKTGQGDAQSSARCSLGQVGSVAPTSAAMSICPCSRAEDVILSRI